MPILPAFGGIMESKIIFLKSMVRQYLKYVNDLKPQLETIKAAKC
jgi:hypothetical protein